MLDIKTVLGQGVPYQRLDGSQLSKRFGMMRFSSSCEAIGDKSGGILNANKCVQAMQVLLLCKFYICMFLNRHRSNLSEICMIDKFDI